MFVCISHKHILTVAGRSWFALRASLRHLEVEYRKSENNSRILRASGFWKCFRICDIPLPSASNWHAKWNNFFHPSITQILTAARKSWFTWRASLRHLEVEYRESKSTSRILRLNFFLPGYARICVWEKGAGLVRPILTCSHPEYTKTPSNLGECFYFLIEKVLKTTPFW
jgi:hypothetical protein